MTLNSMRRRSFREVCRFTAIDQDGNSHIVVERVAMLNDVGAGGKVFDSEYGTSHFYSATSGDAVVNTSEGIFEGGNKNCRIVLKKD